MSGEEKILIQSPTDSRVHSAQQHPVYSDHFVTDCGVVVTTSATRHETNFTEFVIIDSEEITCEDCTSVKS